MVIWVKEQKDILAVGRIEYISKQGINVRRYENDNCLKDDDLVVVSKKDKSFDFQSIFPAIYVYYEDLVEQMSQEHRVVSCSYSYYRTVPKTFGQFF